VNRRLYIQSDGQSLGPATVDEIQSLMEGGWVQAADAGRWEDEEEWKTVGALLSTLPQDEGAQDTARDTKRKSFTVVLTGQPARKQKNIGTKIGIGAVVGFVVVALGVLFYFSPWKSKTRAQAQSSDKRTHGISMRAAVPAPAPQMPNGTNRAVTNPPQPKVKPAAIPMIPSVLTQTSSAAVGAGIKPPSTRRQVVTGGDMKGIGEYDRVLIGKVQKRWLDLMGRAKIGENRTGRVVLEFELRANGLADHVRVIEKDTDEMLCFLCESAVLDSAPFAPWSIDMRRASKADARLVRFTFLY
jgi:hypothetical protein